MNKVDDKAMNGYCLDSVRYDNRIGDECRKEFPTVLNNKIEELQLKLRELNEIKKELANLVYLVMDNDSCFNYIDQDGNTYEYKVINNKPVLISKSFELFEIVEYYSVDDMKEKNENSSWCIKSWVDKVCKVKKL